MAAEYLANAEQLVNLNAPVIFTASIPCRRGYVYHEDETGIFILRGITSNCFATYQVTFNGNIAIPEGGTVTPIAIRRSSKFRKAAASPCLLKQFRLLRTQLLRLLRSFPCRMQTLL